MNWQIRTRLWMSCLVLGVAALVSACGSSGDGGGGATATAQSGTLRVSLTDAPACGFDQVNVTVSKVRVHQSGNANENAAGWSEITVNPPKKINLLDYNDHTQGQLVLLDLGSITLPAGHYTQVRLVLVPNSGGAPIENSVVLSGTTNEIAMDTPSAVQSGLKLVHEFDVPPGGSTSLLLDFDACKSIVQTGNGKYKLKPVIKVVPIALNGIEGYMKTDLLPNHVVVTAQQNGQIIRETVPNAAGKFLLTMLNSPANYDVVITADGRTTSVISGVPVQTSSSITAIGTSGVPIDLALSATQAVNGTVALNPADDDGTVLVAAKQTLAGGPTVTVKSHVATILDAANPVGDYAYAMTLPTGAPELAPFGPLPILPSAGGQAAVAKIYTVQGSATTATTIYNTQNPAASSSDITAVPTKNFTLTP